MMEYIFTGTILWVVFWLGVATGDKYYGRKWYALKKKQDILEKNHTNTLRKLYDYTERCEYLIEKNKNKDMEITRQNVEIEYYSALTDLFVDQKKFKWAVDIYNMKNKKR